MEKKFYFDTIMELQETYPVGSSLVSFKRKIEEIRYFYTKKDLKCLQKEYDEVRIQDEVTAECSKEIVVSKVVEGYLFDGEYWWPAYNTWDGWLPYDEDDLYEY